MVMKSVLLHLKNTIRRNAKAENSLSDETRYRLIADFTHDWEFWRNPQDRFEYVSPSCERISGYPPEAFMADPELYLEIVHPEDREKVRAHHCEPECAADQGECPLEFRIVRADGEVRWLSHVCRPVYDRDDRFLGRRGSNRDITAGKHAEAALRESDMALHRQRELLETILDTVPVGVVLADRLGNITYSSPQVTKLFGAPITNNAAGPAPDTYTILNPDGTPYPGEVSSLVRTVCEGSLQAAVEMLVRRKDGSEIALLADCAPVINKLGRITGAVSTLVDITARKQVEAALRRSEERFREAFEHAPIGMVIMEPDGRFTDINDAYCQMVGYSREELLGGEFTFQRLTHPDDLGHNLAEYDRLFAGEIPAFFVEKRYIRGDGGIIWVRASATLRRDTESNPKQIVALVEDITRRKEAEEQLRHAQKMEAIGRLAGGMAHEFNNMLNVIIGYADLMRMRLEKDNPLTPYLREIETAARRSADLTGQFLAYSRKQVIEPIVIDLNQAVRDQITLLAKLVGEGINIRFHPAAEECPIRIDPSKIDQILANLAVNSRDAMEGSGRVNITTENMTLAPGNIAGNLPPGDYVKLIFTDTGGGMDAATQERIFEPYFTTKDTGKGTGLGLATVYGFVRQSGGDIHVESQPGEGATFTLYFPRSGESVDSPQIYDESPSADGKETLLVVEDEQQLLELTAMILENLGYTVLKAGGPAEAIEMARNYTGKIDFLLSDVIMPGMNGKALKSKIEAIFPGIRTLFMSGYTDDIIVREEILEKDAHLISKPFTGQVLARKIRELLDR